MQIDFHHATTYVAARLAGFPHKEAEIVAHSAQYVDDATSTDPIRFNNKFLYAPISSAHKMIDPRNMKDFTNHQVWIPFHFLPGNEGSKPVERLICKPNSPIAKEMVRQAIMVHDKPNTLHRLGVTMHVYADTWAHQGFAGLLDDVNEVENAEEKGKSDVFDDFIGKWWRDVLDNAIPPLGHGRATIFPDMPFLKWEYKNYKGKKITRDNTTDFPKAANELCKAMQRYLLKDPDAKVDGIGAGDMKEIKNLFNNVLEEKGEKRHEEWLEAIAKGTFSFGKQKLTYITDKKGSWKHQAVGSAYEQDSYPYKKTFLTSNWKLFHDAIQSHRFYVVNELLPKYDICAA